MAETQKESVKMTGLHVATLDLCEPVSLNRPTMKAYHEIQSLLRSIVSGKSVVVEQQEIVDALNAVDEQCVRMEEANRGVYNPDMQAISRRLAGWLSSEEGR